MLYIYTGLPSNAENALWLAESCCCRVACLFFAFEQSFCCLCCKIYMSASLYIYVCVCIMYVFNAQAFQIAGHI